MLSVYRNPILRLSKEKAYEKIKFFCSYQERCRAEVQEKLAALGLSTIQQSELIERLFREGYLDEERFAMQYAGGKFRINDWGRLKIRLALQQKKICPESIGRALQQIPEQEYHQRLFDLAFQKLRSLPGRLDTLMRKRRLVDHLLQKGFESDLVYPLVRSMISA